MKYTLLAIFVLAAPPPEKTPTSKEQLAAYVRAIAQESLAPAEETLKRLRALTNRENFKSMGFDSLEEVPAAELGRALPVLIVRLNELAKYEEKGDAYKLLHPIPEVIYGLTVKGEPRGILEVHKRDGKWKGVGGGIEGPAREYVLALRKQARQDKANAVFIVKVPALNETYFGYQTEQGVRLIHVRRRAEEKEKVKPRPAAAVLAELVQRAKERDGSPQ